jgi:hypothetical protein
MVPWEVAQVLHSCSRSCSISCSQSLQINQIKETRQLSRRCKCRQRLTCYHRAAQHCTERTATSLSTTATSRVPAGSAHCQKITMSVPGTLSERRLPSCITACWLLLLLSSWTC